MWDDAGPEKQYSTITMLFPDVAEFLFKKNNNAQCDISFKFFFILEENYEL